MKKHITIAGVVFLAGLFVLPMTASALRGKARIHPGRMMALMVPREQVKTPTLTTEQIIQIEVLQKKLQDDNADTMKQLMAEIQKETSTRIQEEISILNSKWEDS